MAVSLRGYHILRVLRSSPAEYDDYRAARTNTEASDPDARLVTTPGDDGPVISFGLVFDEAPGTGTGPPKLDFNPAHYARVPSVR